MEVVGSSTTSHSSGGSSHTSSHSSSGSSLRGPSRARRQPIAQLAISAATPRRIATEPRGGVSFAEPTTTAPATVPVRASRPHQLHLRGRGSEDEVAEVASHTSSKFRGLRDGFSPSIASRQRSPPATLLKVFFQFLATQLEF